MRLIMPSQKEQQCISISKKARLLYLLHQMADVKSVPIGLSKEICQSFQWDKKPVRRPLQFGMMPFALLLLLLLLFMQVLVYVSTILMEMWKIIREPSSFRPDEKTIDAVWQHCGLDAGYTYPRDVQIRIISQWLDVLYEGWVNIDISERINAVSVNRAEFRKQQQAYITWGESPTSSAVRALSNELPLYE